MGAVGEQLEHLEKAQGLITQSPVAFLAALLALGVLALASLWVRALLRVEKLQRLHAKELHAREQAHAGRVEELHKDALERAIRLEHLIQGVLRLVTFGGEVRPAPKGKRRGRGRTDPTIRVETAEPPTQVLEEEPTDDE